MPSAERVREFIDRVEAKDHLGAIRDFYHQDATMQENQGQTRSGMAALLAGEEAALKRMGGAPASRCLSYAIHGDTVFINWAFEMGSPDKPRVLDEIAVQTWREDRIAVERFYYDPGTMR